MSCKVLSDALPKKQLMFKKFCDLGNVISVLSRNVACFYIYALPKKQLMFKKFCDLGNVMSVLSRNVACFYMLNIGTHVLI